MENVVIIGSGCAGWTAALYTYTARANLQPIAISGNGSGRSTYDHHHGGKISPASLKELMTSNS